MPILNAFGGGGGGGRGGRLRIKQFLTPGAASFTVPAGVTKVEVIVIGGGGNGLLNYSGGGGGACYAFIDVLPAQDIPVTVGTASGTSSFGTFVTCTGGSSAYKDHRDKYYAGVGGKASTSGIAEADIEWKYDGSSGTQGGLGGNALPRVVNFFGTILAPKSGITHMGGGSAMIGSYDSVSNYTSYVSSPMPGGHGGVGDIGCGGGAGGTGNASSTSYAASQGSGGAGGIGGGGGAGGTNAATAGQSGAGGQGGTGAVFVAWEV